MKLQKYPLKRSAVFHHCCFLKWQLVGSYVIHPILAETWNPPPPAPAAHTHTHTPAPSLDTRFPALPLEFLSRTPPRGCGSRRPLPKPWLALAPRLQEESRPVFHVAGEQSEVDVTGGSCCHSGGRRLPWVP